MTKVYISGVVDAVGLDQPPYPSQGPGFPTNPIAPGGGGGQPPGIWPSPGYPSHPIAPGGQPPGIWPGQGQPSHPIYIPVDPPEGAEGISPEHPIYIPVYPAHPIQPGDESAIREAIRQFVQGNLPPHTQPVQR